MPTWLDALLGRSKAVQPNLDQLFALPSAAVTLQVATNFRPTGVGSVCFKPAEGGGFAGLRDQLEQLLGMDGDKYEQQTDSYGFQWLVRQGSADDIEDLITDLHGVNSGLTDAGFGPALLCTVVVFTDGTHRLGLVYLYKRGSWYPFVPSGDQKRDNALELEIRAQLGEDLKIEPDLTRWFPVWGAPGL